MTASDQRGDFTGVASLLGSHLCKRLLNDCHEFICVNNFFTGTKDNVLPLLTNRLGAKIFQ